MLLTWLLGGVVSLLGALCYAELATAYPHPGGEYHFLYRAYGRGTGFLFAWTRLMIVQTGSIALLAFVFGDYMQQLLPVAGGSAVYAGLAIIVFTALNIAGVRASFGAQRLLTLVTVAGVLILASAGVLLGSEPVALTLQDRMPPTAAGIGMAMVFVLLTFGGWNEAAYVSAEIRDGPRSMVRALVLGILAVTLLYLLTNLAYLRVLGPELRHTPAPGSALMHALFGAPERCWSVRWW